MGARAASSACWAATTASNRMCATRRTPAPAWSTSTPRASSPSTAPPRCSGWSTRACRSRPTPSGPLGLHLTREGGHAVRRIAHAADATGTRHPRGAARRKARAHPQHRAARALDGDRPDHLAPPQARRGAALLRRLRARHRRAAASRRCRRRPWCWPPAAPARSTATPPTPTPPPATASRWRGAPAAASATWSSSSSTRPACTTRRSAAS